MNNTLNYGVNGMIGNYLVVKLKVSMDVWLKVEQLLKDELVQYTIISACYLYKGKNYTKFTALLTPWVLKRVMIIVREVRIQKIQNEINALKSF